MVAYLVTRVGLVGVGTQSVAGVELGAAPSSSGGGLDRVRVDGVVAGLDLSNGKAREGRCGEEDGGVEHVCNKDLRAQALDATALGMMNMEDCAFMQVMMDKANIHGARIREALTCELRVNDLLSSRVVEF